MNKAIRVDTTRTDELWIGLNEVFDITTIKIINTLNELKDYKIIPAENIKENNFKDFFIQFVTVPITNGKEKGLLVSDVFKRIPEEILNYYGDKLFLTSYKECLNLLSNNFIKKENKLDYTKKNTIEYIKEMLSKMELLEAADLNMSWTREKVIITYSVNGESIEENEDIVS